ncbi:erythromycin esterase family protein [Salinimicrobium sp. TIG7-5_MAKvit]
MDLPKGIEGSIERKLHTVGAENKLLLFEEGTDLYKKLQDRIGHRAVGVVYDPHRERGNYVSSKMSKRYDAFLYIDKTKGLHPLHLQPDGSKTPETYPFGI